MSVTTADCIFVKNKPNIARGDTLSPEDRAHVLRSYLHRYTRTHRPGWAKKGTWNGLPFPVQFATDEEWLANTDFAVTANGRLDLRSRYCMSTPTWPDNPELRKSETNI